MSQDPSGAGQGCFTGFAQKHAFSHVAVTSRFRGFANRRSRLLRDGFIPCHSFQASGRFPFKPVGAVGDVFHCFASESLLELGQVEALLRNVACAIRKSRPAIRPRNLPRGRLRRMIGSLVAFHCPSKACVL